MTGSDDRWEGYVARFHDDEPGITEELLGRTDHAGTDPYAWCAEALAGRDGPLLDLACGSGPMDEHLDLCPGWVGVDTSTGELAAARRVGRTALVRGSATRLPVPDDAVATLVCTMSLQVLEPLDEALAELARVLAPGGRIALLLPASWPLRPRDLWTYLRLQLVLRRVIRYPNGAALSPRRLAHRVGDLGLTVVSDERRAFASTVDPESAALLVRSLYLPGITTARRRRGVPVVAARTGDRMVIPLRRVVLDRETVIGPSVDT